MESRRFIYITSTNLRIRNHLLKWWEYFLDIIPSRSKFYNYCCFLRSIRWFTYPRCDIFTELKNILLSITKTLILSFCYIKEILIKSKRYVDYTISYYIWFPLKYLPSTMHDCHWYITIYYKWFSIDIFSYYDSWLPLIYWLHAIYDGNG